MTAAPIRRRGVVCSPGAARTPLRIEDAAAARALGETTLGTNTLPLAGGHADAEQQVFYVEG
jgi:hypothetical protein